MLRFHLYLVSKASTLQGDFKKLYSMSLAFIFTKISRKQPGPAFQSLKKAKIIQYTVNTVICLIYRQYFVCANSLVYDSAGSTSRQKQKSLYIMDGISMTGYIINIEVNELAKVTLNCGPINAGDQTNLKNESKFLEFNLMKMNK